MKKEKKEECMKPPQKLGAKVETMNSSQLGLYYTSPVLLSALLPL